MMKMKISNHFSVLKIAMDETTLDAEAEAKNALLLKKVVDSPLKKLLNYEPEIESDSTELLKGA